MDEIQYINRVAANGCRAKQLVLLLHGRSGNANDMLELASIIQEHNPCTEILIPHGVMPVEVAESPLGQEPPFQRQWFEMNQSRELIWAEIQDLTQRLLPFIQEQLSLRDMPASDLVICGYSQGAIMAFHLGLRLPERIGGVIGYAGMLANPDALANEIRAFPPCYLLHGVQDNIMPIEHFHQARLALFSAGVNVQTELFDDVCHLLTPHVMHRISHCVTRSAKVEQMAS